MRVWSACAFGNGGAAPVVDQMGDVTVGRFRGTLSHLNPFRAFRGETTQATSSIWSTSQPAVTRLWWGVARVCVRATERARERASKRGVAKESVSEFVGNCLSERVEC